MTLRAVTTLRCTFAAAGLIGCKFRRRKMDLTTLGSGFTTPALWVAAAVVFLILLRASNIFRYIPNNQVGIVEKLWTTKGSISEGFIALNGEAGYEPEVLRGGLHVFFPFM